MSQPAENVDELRLIEAVGARSERAFEILYGRYQYALIAFAYRFVRRHSVAEEIVQTVFADLWRHGPSLNLHQSARSYLFGAVRVQAYKQFNDSQRELPWDEARRQARLGLASSPQSPFLGRVRGLAEPRSVNAGEAKVLIDELLRLIPRVIAALREPTQTIYLLEQRDGLSYNEIARAMGMTPNAVRKRMIQAHRYLEVRFTELGWPGLVKNRGPLTAGALLRARNKPRRDEGDEVDHG